MEQTMLQIGHFAIDTEFDLAEVDGATGFPALILNQRLLIAKTHQGVIEMDVENGHVRAMRVLEENEPPADFKAIIDALYPAKTSSVSDKSLMVDGHEVRFLDSPVLDALINYFAERNQVTITEFMETFSYSTRLGAALKKMGVETFEDAPPASSAVN